MYSRQKQSKFDDFRRKQSFTCNPRTSRTHVTHDEVITPETFRGYPKAEARKSTKQGRKRKGKSCIATDTPIKNEFEERARERQNRVNKKKGLKKQVLPESSDSCNDEDDISIHLDDDSDDDVTCFPAPDETESHRDPQVDDFVLVKFPGKRSVVYYVGKILKEKNKNEEYEVTYLRTFQRTKNKFVFPAEPDVALLSEDDIVLILPEPFKQGQTKRQNAAFVFPVNLRHYNVL